MVSTWPGITVSERTITMAEVVAALAEDRLVEMFGAGTAAVVSPVGGLHYEGQMLELPTPTDGLAVRVLAAMNDIYYGRVPHPWAVDVEDWNLDVNQVNNTLLDYLKKSNYIFLLYIVQYRYSTWYRYRINSKTGLD
jgi:hypothetical protein